MNTLGNIFKVHSFGESHGPYVGAIIDGCPAGLKLDMQAIQQAVDKRKTGQHDFSSSRKEDDIVEIVSGVFEGRTLGSPICILIKNKDARPADYDDIKNVYRPGHADFTYDKKYGLRDYRGGGRSSIRITAPMVAAGAIAKQYIQTQNDIVCNAFVSQIGSAFLDVSAVQEVGLTSAEQLYLKTSGLNSISPDFTAAAQQLIAAAGALGDTLGGSVSMLIENLPVGLGEPIFGKVQAQLAHAMMSINTVKAISFGDGIKTAAKRGSENNDAFYNADGAIATKTNHHAGILGGMTSGNRLLFSIYFKPITSIKKEQETVNSDAAELSIRIEGRHDVCAVPRAVPIVEAYAQIVLADLILQNTYAKI